MTTLLIILFAICCLAAGVTGIISLASLGDMEDLKANIEYFNLRLKTETWGESSLRERIKDSEDKIKGIKLARRIFIVSTILGIVLANLIFL